MSWKATDPMKERTKFVLEWERRWNEAEGGQINMAELCRMFGVSRPTGYKWVDRYREAQLDVTAVAERSRRPKTSPNALPLELQDLIVDARKPPTPDTLSVPTGRVSTNPASRGRRLTHDRRSSATDSSS